MTLHLPIAYFPNIEYFTELLRAEKVIIQTNEVFQKQTFRNRCVILNANGLQQLSVPVERVHGKDQLTSELKISYAENWVKNHLKSFESAYKNAPYYEYYIDRITEILESEVIFLSELNFELLQYLVEKTGLSCEVKIDNSTLEISKEKNELANPKSANQFTGKKYYQTFSERFEFQNNLSIVDLLFNEGPNAISVLSETKNIK
ncbi:MAG: WbqC family protein [Crocinitomicaceae bacterium]|nr:WbqC family protein [Crocinitomicaceae bacterium]